MHNHFFESAQTCKHRLLSECYRRQICTTQQKIQVFLRSESTSPSMTHLNA
ncbi:hypothetical protein LguiA_013573 [Lonicera macranthoides]